MTSESPNGGRWNLLAEELQALRRTAGDPSYAEVARRISERRLAQGASPHAARVARTTVYDAFRTGRARVNVGLVREIAEALGGSADEVTQWVARCQATEPAGQTPTQPAPAPSTETPLTGTTPTEAEPSKPEPTKPGSTETGPTEPGPTETGPTETGRTAPAPREPLRRPSTRHVLALMVACVVANVAGRFFVDFLHLPIYLDMVGTAIAAITLGPWHGAFVGCLTNLVGVGDSGWGYIAFAPVNVAGALVWGYGIRRWRLGSSLPRFFVLNILVAAVCTLVAVPLLVLAFGGTTGHGQDVITHTFLALTDRLGVAVGFSNLLVSVGDKMISGFVALVAVSALPVGMRRGLRLPLVTSPDPEVPAHQPSEGPH